MLRFSGVGYSASGCRVTLNGGTIPARSVPQAVRLLEVRILGILLGGWRMIGAGLSFFFFSNVYRASTL